MIHCRVSRWCIAALLSVVMPSHAAAQQSATADTVTGRVTAPDSAPVPFARVRVTSENGRSRDVSTDTAGRYFAVMANAAGSNYMVRATAFGYLPLSVIVERTAASNHVQRDLRLNAVPVTLSAATVVAKFHPRVQEKTTPAEREARWSSFLSGYSTADPGNFADVGAMQPGVERVGNDGSQLSVAGQSPDQNHTTVDGASYGGANLPSEGVGSVAVISNTYDVAHGQFSGGQIAATTVSGTNIWGGAFSMRLDDPALQYGALPGSSARKEQRVRFSGGGGGALMPDKLFVYSALDLTRGRSPASGLELLNPAALRTFQLSPDSVRRFLGIAQHLGLPSSEANPADNYQRDFTSMLTRLDYMISEHHSVTARLDWRGSNFGGLGASPLHLLSGAGEQRSRDGGTLLELTSGWGLWANALRGYYSSGSMRADERSGFPFGEVDVSSALADATAGTSQLTFGGTPFKPRGDHSLREIADDLIRDSGKHRIKAGLLLQQERAAAPESGNRYGTFLFNSLADLEHGEPVSFTRNLAGRPGAAVRQYAALYLGDTWRQSDRLGLVYGARLDRNSYGGRPQPTLAVASLVPDNSGQVPAELLLTPRVGFTYALGGPRDVAFEGGIGGFSGALGIQSLAPDWNATGGAGANLICVGPASPSPDWSSYIADPRTIPSTCAGGAPLFSSNTPSVSLFARHYGVPRNSRASLGVSWRLSPRWSARLDGLVVHGTHLPTAVDRNLVFAPGLTLPQENERPVYVGTDGIDPATGGISPAASRIQPSLGSVREINSVGQSWTEQLTGGANGMVAPGILLSVYYTFTRSRVLQGGIPVPGAVSGSTAGDPARLEWGDGPFTRRHALQAIMTGSIPWLRQLRVTALGGVTSGIPFTPMVSGDINGDGFANDRSFIFDPNGTTDPVLGRDMAQLVSTAPAGIRSCLREQAGRIAAANVCRTPWSPSLDLRAEFLAVGNINTRHMILTLTASNVTSGLDYLLHGADRLRGWGQYATPDPTLLQVRGFDPERRAFQYAVNPRFGQPVGSGLLRSPFRIALEARIAIGADPRYQPLLRVVEAGLAGAPEQIRAQVTAEVRNVPAVLLRMASADSGALGLTLPQRAQLQAVADSLGPKIEATIDTLSSSLAARGPMTAARRARLQQQSERAHALQALALLRTREILTREQWDKLPAWLAKPADLDRLQRPELRMSVPNGSP